ncbi:hypothetical protein FRC09_009872 [Ceratobasidium sp. 395]|nr:hypothetical protein FRC09_009872 [Ceratobasidium sp. 395]
MTPGVSGVDFMFGGGQEIMQAAGGQYDVVSKSPGLFVQPLDRLTGLYKRAGWDPRGVGLTNPRADCFRTGTEENAFWQGTIPRAGLEARGNFTDPGDLAAFNAQVPEVDVLLKQLGEQCLKFSPNTYQYVGSVAVVRDLLAMNDYLEGPNKTVNFWGLSYGTLLGAYLVNMFPNRVGRVVLDGVVDPVVWSTRPGHEIWNITVESVDEAFTGFVTACAAAGPAGCAIASPGSSADSIRDGVHQLMDQTSEDTIYLGMYSPTDWPQLAQELRKMSNFLDNPAAGVPNKRWISEPPPHHLARRQNAPDPNDPAPDYAFQAVVCADSIDAGNVTTQTVFDSLVDTTRTTSQMCEYLLQTPGSHPVLIVIVHSRSALEYGNEADPATPFISAKRVADALGDSATLIEQDDFGHISLAMHPDCTMDALKNYFLTNAVPAQDTFCGTNQVLFPGPGITKNTLSAIDQDSNASEMLIELEKVRMQGQRLAVAVAVLACIIGLLLLSFVVRSVHRLKSKQPLQAAFHSGANRPKQSHQDESKTALAGPVV